MDAVEEWTRAQERVTELMAPLGRAEAELPVPACPDWTTRQLLAHMVGLDVDVLADNEDDDHNSAWTQRQVDDRAEVDVSGILDEWRSTTTGMQAWMRDHGDRPLGDVVIHEQDLRGALGRVGGRETTGLAAIRDRMAERFAQKVRDSGRPPVLLASDRWTFATGDGSPGLTLRAPTYDLSRALMSRRSAGQLGSWVVGGDLEPYLEAFEVLGPLPTRDLVE